MEPNDEYPEEHQFDEADRVITDFVRSIAPEAPELYLALFDELRALKDATELISRLRAIEQAARRMQRADAEAVAALQQIAKYTVAEYEAISNRCEAEYASARGDLFAAIGTEPEQSR